MIARDQAVKPYGFDSMKRIKNIEKDYLKLDLSPFKILFVSSNYYLIGSN